MAIESVHTWECPPMTGLQISIQAGVVNPEFEEPGEGSSSFMLRKGRRASLMATLGSLHREAQALTPARLQEPCLLPSLRRIHACTERLSTSRNDLQQSASPISPLVSGVLIFNPCRMEKASKPVLPLAALPHGHQVICKRCCCFLIRSGPYQKALVMNT